MSPQTQTSDRTRRRRRRFLENGSVKVFPPRGRTGVEGDRDTSYVKVGVETIASSVAVTPLRSNTLFREDSYDPRPLGGSVGYRVSVSPDLDTIPRSEETPYPPDSDPRTPRTDEVPHMSGPVLTDDVTVEPLPVRSTR